MDPLDNMDDLLPGFLQKKETAMAGFRLPDGYFEQLGDQFFETLQSGGHEDAAPGTAFLGEIKPVGGGHSLPGNYFEKLPDRVLEKIGPGGKTVELAPKRPFFNLIKRPAALAAAASMAILIGAVGYFLNKEEVGTPGPMACNVACLSEKISAEDVQFYLSENLSEFSTDELATEALVGEMNFPATQTEPTADEVEPILKEMLDELSTEELEEML